MYVHGIKSPSLAVQLSRCQRIAHYSTEHPPQCKHAVGEETLRSRFLLGLLLRPLLADFDPTSQ